MVQKILSFDIQGDSRNLHTRNNFSIMRLMKNCLPRRAAWLWGRQNMAKQFFIGRIIEKSRSVCKLRESSCISFLLKSSLLYDCMYVYVMILNGRSNKWRGWNVIDLAGFKKQMAPSSKVSPRYLGDRKIEGSWCFKKWRPEPRNHHSRPETPTWRNPIVSPKRR